MSGMEAAGLALGVFPVVISLIDMYSGSVTGRDIRYLIESLKNNEKMFLNSVESLLRSVTSPSEVQVLLGDLSGAAWKDPRLSNKVVEHLGGPEAEGKRILEMVNDVYRTVSALKVKLPVRYCVFGKILCSRQAFG
jgi:hypothetical protein